MNLFHNKSTRVFILAMIALVASGFFVSHLYYDRENSAIDPRVTGIRKAYGQFDRYAGSNDFIRVFRLLDSIEGAYNNIKHYRKSFEKGVLYNNRAAAYLTLALHRDSLHLPADNVLYRIYTKDSLLQLANHNVDKSLEIYHNWIDRFENKDPARVRTMIRKDFLSGLTAYEDQEQEKFLEKRIEEITDAQFETARRLSVSYTNRGIIQRHQKLYKEAIRSYQKAIELWDRNLTAENNLNILLGKPIKKRNFIQKMFPPKKDKK
ncbi:MAG: tetratricopeptide repeat protein [Bacteroidales bacterium]|nr:tetratricopeptide repeat protein [Bacteroidales bacterium]